MPPQPTNPVAAIELRGLVKCYGARRALDGVDLTVPRGCFFGLLGPNGAGKTTTVAVLTTLTRPSEGTASVLGHDVVSACAAVRRELGVVFQEPSLDRELTAREHLDLQARLYHLEDRRERVPEALEQAGLGAEADRPVRHFSGGMKRRLEIARGLLHRPRVLFLDEPTLGLDVQARRGVWERLERLREGGEVSVFLTTHSMEEADRLCERLAILDGGRIVAEGSPEALKAALGGDLVVLTLAQPEGAAAALERAEGVARVAAEGPGAEEKTQRLRVTLADGPRRLPALLDAARRFGVIEVTLHRPSLEDVFLHHTGHRFENGPPDGEPV